MKAKLKNAGGFSRFMLAHGEKLGMSAVMALALLLIYSSLGRDRLGEGRQPTDLQSAASAADANVARMTWDALPEEERTDPANFVVSVDPQARVVDPDDGWEDIAELDPPAVPRASKRTDPELLPLERMEVSTGAGLIATIDPEVQRRRMLEMAREEQEEEREEEERQREEEEERGRGRRGGRGRDDFGGGRGYGGDGGMTTKDGVLVVRPSGGAELQGGEEVRNRSWVIVKAKVPIRAQVKQYLDALATARGYQAMEDVPKYLGYEVQRAEVSETGEPGEWEQVAQITARKLIDEMESWPINTPDEFVAPKYNHPMLTFPLPPMVLRAWDTRVTHTDLPLPPPEDFSGDGDGGRGRGERGGRGNRDDDDDDDDEGEGDGNLFDEAAQDGQEPMGGGDGGRFSGGDGGPRGGGGFRGMDGGGPRGGGFRGMGDGGPRGRGGDGGEYRGGSMGGGRGSVSADMFSSYSWDGQTRFLLFRYFDRDVQPGKRYRYRVRLALTDVNQNIQPQFLDNTVLERREKENKPFRYSPWSEESPVAVVPQAGLVYVAGADPANPAAPNIEPEAEILIKSLDGKTASEMALAEDFTRGTVLNLIGQKAKIIWSNTFEAADRNGEPVESPAFDFRTGVTLLDFIGGQSPTGNRSLTAPARALFMDTAGRLMVKNELEDLTQVSEYDAYMEAAAEAVREETERERGGGRGERGGGRGGRGGGRNQGG